jgi:sirohydrochlorin cobaltochelatase
MKAEPMNDRALILFAHGARDPRWAAPFEAVAARLRARQPGRAVVLAYLELMPPTLGEAAAALHAEGVRRIDVLPLFLGTGGHLRRDLPAQAEAACAALPGLTMRLHPAVGEHPALTEAMAGIATNLLAEPADTTPNP